MMCLLQSAYSIIACTYYQHCIFEILHVCIQQLFTLFGINIEYLKCLAIVMFFGATARCASNTVIIIIMILIHHRLLVVAGTGMVLH